MAALDARMLRFLEVFARTLDAPSAATIAGVELDEAEARFARSKALQRRLKGMFERRLSLFDHVPVSVVRAELLGIMADPSVQVGHRVQAAKILLDIVGSAAEDGRENVGRLLRAIENSADPE